MVGFDGGALGEDCFGFGVVVWRSSGKRLLPEVWWFLRFATKKGDIDKIICADSAI